ncbi:MFS transporter, partial [Francisella tularensis subsp. holarctica]|nr:MFS transporter [Francisella tularensis subsp. holarctica]
DIDSGDNFNINENKCITIAFIIVLALAFIIMRSMIKKIKHNS